MMIKNMSKGFHSITGTFLLQPHGKAIARAADIIRRGGLVAFPTETVYGLGAAATDAAAVRRIFQVKGRPADNPLIVHVSAKEQLYVVAASLPEGAAELVDRFWPCPLSLVLPRSSAIPDEVSAGLPTVAVRMPSHPVALRLIARAGVPIAAPSANRSGRPSPTMASHVLADLAGRIDAVIDGGPCPVGVESTVLDLTGAVPLILRPGAITAEAIAKCLGRAVEIAGKYSGKPPSPGMKYRHYSPRAPLLLITGPPALREKLIAALKRHYQRRNLKVGLLIPDQSVAPAVVARRLYRALRAFDQQGVDLILAQEIPAVGLGAAVMNRLAKAATRIIKA